MSNFLRPNPDYKCSTKTSSKNPGFPVDLSEPEENKKAIECLDKEFRVLVKNDKINKKKVLDYVQEVIKVINEKDDY